MSPEQVLSQPVDGRSDLFSLGVILYELATGKRPFRGENMAAMFRNITGEDPPEPMKINPAVPHELSRIIIRCLAKSPENRFGTGKDLAEALRNCCRVHSRFNGERSACSRQEIKAGTVLLLSMSASLIIGCSVWLRVIKSTLLPENPCYPASCTFTSHTSTHARLLLRNWGHSRLILPPSAPKSWWTVKQGCHPLEYSASGRGPRGPFGVGELWRLGSTG